MSDSEYAPLADDDLPRGLKELCDANAERFSLLQRYIDTPPGDGMGVIYVEVSPSAKMYVGKHEHGRTGRSYAQTRMLYHQRCPAISAAYSKYGTTNFKVFIIDHRQASCPTDDDDDRADLNTLEKFYISADGLDTIAPKGYNIASGGQGGPLHPQTIAKLRTAWTVEKRMQRSSEVRKRWAIPDGPMRTKRSSYLGKEHMKNMRRQRCTETMSKNTRTRNLQNSCVRLPQIKALFSKFLVMNPSKTLAHLKNNDVVDGVKLGILQHNIRRRFNYVRESPEFTTFLKDNGFRMDTRDPTKDLSRWEELNVIHSSS